jgi:outer membrane receptor protein involved in Fe transport
LNQLPQFTTAGTASTLSAASTPFPAATAAPGAATLNLRGLGTNRTLILFDGRRAQPVNGQLDVDLNTIPSSAIQTVEVITGGAAAVYGADAIAGVVNFILKKNFQGAEFTGQYGLTEEGDGQEIQVSMLVGTNIADNRGNIMLGANYVDRRDIFGKDREWMRRGWDDPGTMGGGLGSSNIQQYVITGGNAPTAGFPLAALGSTYSVDQNGKVFDVSDPRNAAHPYTGPLGGDSGFKINPDGTLGYNDRIHNYLQLPIERYALFGSANYSVTDNISLFSDLRYSESRAQSRGFVSQLFNIWSPTVPYNPLYDDPASPQFGRAPAGVAMHPVSPQLAAILNSRPTPNAPWTFQGGLDYLPNYETDTTSNVFQLTMGLRGDITPLEGWTWEVYGTHGKSTINAQQPEGFPYLPRIQNLFNANQYGKGYAVSFPIAVTGGCTTGLPIFNPDGSVNNTPSVSQDCADYTVLRMNSISTLTQEVLEGTVQGSLFNLPAGPLQMAAGLDTRRDVFNFDPDSGYNANQDYANVVQNIILPVRVQGKTDVKEAYIEFAIPLLKDLPLIKSLELDPGYRFSDYNTSGNTSTYKILADWAVTDWVRFRGGYQRANRAANVTELFTPKGGSSLNTGTDACAYYPANTPTWGNRPENPNRLNLQILCQYLMTRDGAPASLYVPGASANSYAFNVFGTTTYFPFVIGQVEGNPNLLSEKANTVTAGIVFNSPFDAPALRRLTFSVDYYKIDIDGAIGTPNHDTIYQQCLDGQYNSLIGSTAGSHSGAELAASNPFCALIQREYVANTPNVYGADRKYKAQYLNQGGITTRGIDVQLDWGTMLSDIGMASVPGAFSANIQYSKLGKYAIAAFPGAAFIDNAGTTVNSSFDYRLFTTLGYVAGPVSVGLRWQHLPGLDRAPGTPATTFGVESHDQFDLFGRWSMSSAYELRAGIDNLLNVDPEVVGATTTNNALNTTSPNYDTIGRRFFVAFKASF